MGKSQLLELILAIAMNQQLGNYGIACLQSIGNVLLLTQISGMLTEQYYLAEDITP